MKATEVLKRYAAGERNFQGVNLRGQSFKGAELSGADFSAADIRGANFKNATLRGTKFCRAKAGLQKRGTFILLIVSWIMSATAAFIFAFANNLVSFFFYDSLKNQIAGWVSLGVLIVIFAVIIHQGIGGAVGLVGAFAGAFALAGSFDVAFGGVYAGFGVVAGVIAGVVAFTFTFGFAFAFAKNYAVAFAFGVVLFIAKAFVLAYAGMLLSIYIAWRAMKGDPRDAWVRTIAVASAATGGTSFYNADLTDADFSGATLHSTDLRAKSLTRTCFKDTKKLIQARPGKTLLADSNVRELLVTGYGYKKSYINANLRGAYLAAANLNEANLTQADLGEANLHQANLEWAILTQINAIGTDFTKANMTGACLEAWNIESSTLLDEVDCRFVYLLEHPKPGTDDRERRPSSGDFEPGEFTKLFEEVIDTVDLIFRNGIDWKAFVSAFKQVQVENEDTPLTIQSIENKGDGVVVVKVSVPQNTDKEKIHQEFNQNYDLALKAIEEKYKAQLEAKDIEIANHHKYYASLEKITEALANKPIQIENKAMNIRDVGGDFKPVGAPILSDNVEISGTVAENIKALLTQLNEAIADPNLPEQDKQQALKQIQALAQAFKNSKDETL